MTDPTARRAAMAEALRGAHDKMFQREGWNADEYWAALAEAADVAAQKQRKEST